MITTQEFCEGNKADLVLYNDKIKDQLDEFRHAADKLQKAESVIDKYKKKLEEGTELRRRTKVS